MNILLVNLSESDHNRNRTPCFNLSFFRYVLEENGHKCRICFLTSETEAPDIPVTDGMIIECSSYSESSLRNISPLMEEKSHYIFSTGNHTPKDIICDHITPFSVSSLADYFSIDINRDYFREWIPDFSPVHREIFLYPVPVQRKIDWIYSFTGTGCPGKCRFCSGNIRKSPRTPIRKRSIQSIKCELIKYYNNSYRGFAFEDDNLFRESGFIRELLQMLSSEFDDIVWSGHARGDQLTDVSLCRLMKTSGCSLIRIGLESASPPLLAECGKGHDYLQKTMISLSNLEENNIPYMLLIIVGLPGETLKDVFNTLRVVLLSKAFLIQMHYFVPYEDSYYGRILGVKNDYHYSYPNRTFSRYPGWLQPVIFYSFHILFLIRTLLFYPQNIKDIIMYYSRNRKVFYRILKGLIR